MRMPFLNAIILTDNLFLFHFFTLLNAFLSAALVLLLAEKIVDEANFIIISLVSFFQ